MSHADITWQLLDDPPAPGQLPDADITVLLAYGDEGDVCAGWCNGIGPDGVAQWRDTSAWPVQHVYAWADMPAAPEVRRDAAPTQPPAEQQGRAQLLQQLADLRGERGAMAALMRELLDVVLTIQEPESDDEARLLLDLETKAAAMLAEIDQQASNRLLDGRGQALPHHPTGQSAA